MSHAAESHPHDPSHLVTPPATPLYRITLFFGPEALDEDPATRQCVFNVKKRSWKAGIQVSVHLADSDLASVDRTLNVRARLGTLVATVPPDERADMLHRAHECWQVELARIKLQHALDAGLPQENGTLPVTPTDAAHWALTSDDIHRLLAHLRSELDLPDDHSQINT